MPRRLPSPARSFEVVQLIPLAPLACFCLLAAMLLVPATFQASRALLPGQHQPLDFPLAAIGPRQFALSFTMRLPEVPPAALPETAATSGESLRRLELGFVTSRYALRLKHATLRLGEGAAERVYVHGPVLLWDGDTLAFSLPEGVPDAPANATLPGRLEVELLDHGALALVTAADPEGVGLMQLGGGRAALGEWRWQPQPGEGARLALLAGMWNSASRGWILVALGGASLAACLGMLVWPRRPALACAGWMLALGMAHAVITPPFQAPDEPDHFLSLARMADAPALAESGKALARAGHFQRIKHNSHERFGPWDLGRPAAVAWDEFDATGIELVGDSRMEERSVATTFLWRAAMLALPLKRAGPTLLAMRLGNVLLLAAAAGLGAWIAGRVGVRIPLFLFVIPTLPFFGMHLSNYAQFTALSLVLACLGLAGLRGGEEPAWLGLGLGLAAALLTLTANTGMAALALPMALGVGGLGGLSGQGGRDRAARRRFWGGLALGLGAMALGAGSPQMTRVLAAAGRALQLESAPPGGLALAGLWLACAAGWGVETLLSPWRGGLWRPGRWASLGLAWALAVFLLYSGFQAFTIQPNSLTGGDRLGFLRKILANLPTLWTFREPDTLLSATFWGGFGWHDALLPWRATQALAGLTGAGLAAALWQAGREGLGWRALCWLAGGAGMLLTTAAMTALAAGDMGLPNVHGRYLLASQCALAAGAWAGWQRWWRGGGTGSGATSSAAAMPSSAARAGREMFVHGWLLAGAGLTLALGVMRFSLPHVFGWLPVNGLHLAMAAGFVLLAWVVARREGLVLDGKILLAGLAVLGAGVAFAELGYGLPWVFVRYPYGFFVVLTAAGLGWLAWRLALWPDAPDPRTRAAWRRRVAALAALALVALHGGCLAFLMRRYLG